MVPSIQLALAVVFAAGSFVAWILWAILLMRFRLQAPGMQEHLWFPSKSISLSARLTRRKFWIATALWLGLGIIASVFSAIHSGKQTEAKKEIQSHMDGPKSAATNHPN